MISKLKKLKRGFTLIETMIAILVLMSAIVGPLVIAEQGLQSTLIAKDQDTAFYLAQDAVEYVRWVRDTNRLSGGDWLVGPGAGNLAPCEGANGCYIDSLQNMITACTSGGCPVLNYSTAYNYYTYSSGPNIAPTLFTRTITLTTPVGTNAGEANLTVKVSWSDQSGTGGPIVRNVTVREDLFNWQ